MDDDTQLTQFTTPPKIIVEPWNCDTKAADLTTDSTDSTVPLYRVLAAIQVMLKYPKASDVQIYGLRELLGFTCQNAGNTGNTEKTRKANKRLIETGVIETLCNAIENHETWESINYNACHIIINIIQDDPEIRKKFGVVAPVVLKVMKQFKDSVKFQKITASVVALLSLNCEVNLDALKLIIESMQRFPDDYSLQWISVYALRNIVQFGIGTGTVSIWAGAYDLKHLVKCVTQSVSRVWLLESTLSPNTNSLNTILVEQYCLFLVWMSFVYDYQEFDSMDLVLQIMEKYPQTQKVQCFGSYMVRFNLPNVLSCLQDQPTRRDRIQKAIHISQEDFTVNPTVLMDEKLRFLAKFSTVSVVETPIPIKD